MGELKRKYRISLVVLMTTVIVQTSVWGSVENGLEGVEVLREDLVTKGEEGRLQLSPEPLRERIVSPASILFDFEASDMIQEPGGVQIEADFSDPGSLELTGYYDGYIPFLFTRRSSESSDEKVLRWQVNQVDRLTSVSVSLRSAHAGNVTLHSIKKADFSSLPLSERVAALGDRPLRVARHLDEGEENSFRLQLSVPSDTISEFKVPEPYLRVVDPADEENNELRPLGDFEIKDSYTRTIKWIEQDFKLSQSAGSSVKISIEKIFGDEMEVIASTEYVIPETNPNSLEYPFRSIEDFTVIERNGELCFYSVVANAGEFETDELSPLTDQIWLSVYNGDSWPVNEPLLTSRRDIEWLAGGPHSISIVELYERFQMVFSTTYFDGREGLSVASSKNSLRVQSSARNPVIDASEVESKVPSLWRGNALFNFNESALNFALRIDNEGNREVEGYLSRLQTVWSNTGSPVIEGLSGSATWISSYQDGDRYYLLAGPELQLFTSTQPLAVWEEGVVTRKTTTRKAEIVKWQDRIWLVTLLSHSGKGYIQWDEVDLREDVLEIP